MSRRPERYHARIIVLGSERDHKIYEDFIRPQLLLENVLQFQNLGTRAHREERSWRIFNVVTPYWYTPHRETIEHYTLELPKTGIAIASISTSLKQCTYMAATKGLAFYHRGLTQDVVGDLGHESLPMTLDELTKVSQYLIVAANKAATAIAMAAPERRADLRQAAIIEAEMDDPARALYMAHQKPQLHASAMDIIEPRMYA